MTTRLIIASNRGPVSWQRQDDGTWSARRGAGGLIVALGGALQHHPGTWVSVALSEGDREMAAAHPDRSFEADTGQGRFTLRLLDVGERYDRYYNEVCNRLLWFTLHQLWAEPYEPTGIGWPAAWEDYVTVNAAVADAVVAEAGQADESEDLEIHLQDYHLLVAAPRIRQALPHARILLYIHTPWVHPTYLRRLPDAIVAAVLAGMAACDLVGVSAPEWAQNLRDCMTDLGAGHADFDRIRTPSGSALVRDFVLGIDAEGLAAVAASEAAMAEREALTDRVGDRRLIVRADRTDLSKNILRGLHAFEMLLEQHPDLVDQVHFRMLLNPSRQGVPEYREYLQRCVDTAEEIRSRWGGAVLSMDTSNNFPAVVAALQSYDVLILSRNAGAATVMGGALVVNPFDVHEQAEALHAALQMDPAERASRAALLKAEASQGRPADWLAAQQDALREGS